MFQITDDKIYFDGYLVGRLELDVPPSIRDRVLTYLEIAGAEGYWCEECNMLVIADD